MISAFGARVRVLRRQLGISKAELARRILVHSTYVGKIENGVLKVAPSVAVITRLERALGVPPGELRELAGREDIAELKRELARLRERIRELEAAS